jgi:hypothetical protein
MRPATWSDTRQRYPWPSHGLATWTEGSHAYISVVFSWNAWHIAQGYTVHVGGPAAAIDLDYFAAVSSPIVPVIDALKHHNPNATRTTTGCINKCPFCLVPLLEGDLRELRDWIPKPIVLDNNALAASRRHFDRMIDRLKPIPHVDFNQGLDHRLLTPHHAGRLAELDMPIVRLAWDRTTDEPHFLRAFQHLRDAGFPARRIRAYVLIGFDDTPADALYRLQTILDLGARPNPMRYQPLTCLRRNQHVAPNWSDAELKRYMRYWANLRVTSHIPFDRFTHRGAEPTPPPPAAQLSLAIP